MGAFDDRERGFERKFANDQEQEFRAAARRNRMLGEWAAGLMGLENVDDYARAMVKSHLEHPGEEDVLRKIKQDLAGSGKNVSESEIRAKMDEFLALARSQIHSAG
jgi:hypothetical protein